VTRFSGRRCLVVGLGVSGFAAARALLAQGAEVLVTEERSGDEIEARAAALRAGGARVETGGHDLGRLSADVAVISPGIPPWASVARALQEARIEVIGEIELAWELASCDFLAVTGTNGKTTTTTLLSQMLAASGIACAAAGNIGLALVDAVSSIPEGGAVAVEVSSFQLTAIKRFRPRVAVILNIAEDHTDWHGSFEAYASAKARILVNQRGDDVCVANVDDDVVVEIARSGRARVVPFSTARVLDRGACVIEGKLAWMGEPLVDASEVPLVGVAGLQDALAAAGAALSFGARPEAVADAITSFRPLAHRLEAVREVDGVVYVDDSKATNPHATLAAVRGFDDVVLIAGGRAKDVDLTPLRSTVPPVRAVVAIGESAPAIERVFEGLVPVARASTMDEAVARARGLSSRGGSVLLSPGCASLDMYDGYAARGADFARAVHQLQAAEGPDSHT
jgi:UDP-N-acetylmuramoylalanine--D-glutamate ligase